MLDFGFFAQLSGVAITIIAIIISILIVAMISSIILRGKYREMGRDILNPSHREAGRFNNKTLNKIIEDYKSISKKKQKRRQHTGHHRETHGQRHA